MALLLVATAVAFVHTERLKLTPSPIIRTKVDKAFSPVCDCDTDIAVISFVLRRADTVSLEIVDSSGTVVRELVRDTRRRKGRVEVIWNGRDDSAAVVADGTYRPRVKLTDERRTIDMPNDIRVDTTPPKIAFLSVRPRRISPDGDRRSDLAVVRYRANEPASVRLLVNGLQQVRKRGQQVRGRIDWSGQIGGVPAEAGTYALSVVAIDTAGNVGVQSRERDVVVRYVALGRSLVRTVAGARFALLVRSDAREISWQLGRRTGSARPGTLKLQAPLEPGRYTLTVDANGHKARAAVIVREATTG